MIELEIHGHCFPLMHAHLSFYHWTSAWTYKYPQLSLTEWTLVLSLLRSLLTGINVVGGGVPGYAEFIVNQSLGGGNV